MQWTCVFRGGDPAEAFLVRDWLVLNEIPVEVRGDLSSGRGELPIVDTWPTVWVPQDERERALAAIAVQQGPRLVHPNWVCRTCGEENAPNFGSCWSCGTDSPAVTALSRGPTE